MPKGAADIEIVLGSALQEERDTQIGCETQGGDRHDPAAVHRDGLQQSLESNERDAEGREQQDERIQERRNDAGSVIPKCFGFCGRPGRKEMGVEGKKERALVDEVMARIAHESHAIEDPSANELSDDDPRVQG